MKKFVSLILAVCMLVIPLTAYAEGDDNMQYVKNKSYYADIFEKELLYLEQLTLECGAVGMYPPSVSSYYGITMPEVDGVSPEEYTKWPSARVVPYFSDTAVLGAIRADSAMGTERAREYVLKYINWYISHMNTKESDVCGVAGTVYDYRIFQSGDGRTVEVPDPQYNGGKDKSDYDSTDSYAAMFLQILYEYSKAYDAAFLNDKADIVQTLVDVMMSVYVYSLNLTVAKPNYRACYLMDNCEVYCGFVSAAAIWTELLNDSEKAAECASRAEKVKTAILTRMWDKKDRCFLAAVSDNGGSMFKNDLTNFYPQASCQLFPIIFGVIDKDDEKAAIVYERFKNDFGKSWLTFTVGDYPWCVLLRAAVRMEDYEFAGKFLDACKRRFIKRLHSAPFYNSESGSVVIAAAYLYAIAPEDPLPEESSEEEISETVTEPASEELSAPPSAAPESEPAPPESEGGSGALPFILAGIGAAAIAVAALAIVFRKKRGKKE